MSTKASGGICSVEVVQVLHGPIAASSQTMPVTLNGKPIHGKVLVVDGEPAVLKVICAFLEHESLETLAACDSETALDLFNLSNVLF